MSQLSFKDADLSQLWKEKSEEFICKLAEQVLFLSEWMSLILSREIMGPSAGNHSWFYRFATLIQELCNALWRVV